MKSPKISTLLVIATLPFFASCASWNTATISVGLKNKDLTYTEAEDALKNGANVKESWAGKCLLEEAAEQNRQDLIELFVEKGGVSCFVADTGHEKFFSLFEYAVEMQNLELVKFSLSHPDPKNREQMLCQILRVSENLFPILEESYRQGMDSWIHRRTLEEICESGILNEESAQKFNPKIAATNGLLHLILQRSDNYGSYRTLLSLGANADAKSQDGKSLMFLSMENDLPVGILSLLKSHSAKWVPEEANEILRRKIAMGIIPSTEFLHILIGLGGNINTTHSNGKSLISLSIEKGGEYADVERFFALGAKCTPKEATKLLLSELIAGPNISSSARKTEKTADGIILNLSAIESLEKGAENSDFILKIETLIAQGADVNARTDEGGSLLAIALEKKYSQKVVSTLCSAGAVLAKEEATTILRSKVGNGSLLKNPELLKMLVSFGGDLNIKIGEDSLLFVALKKGILDELENTLLDLGATCSSDEATLILRERAAFDNIEVDGVGDSETVTCGNTYTIPNTTLFPLPNTKMSARLLRALIRFGANLDIRNEDNETLVFHAWSQNRNGEFFKVLWDAGARFSEKEQTRVDEILHKEKVTDLTNQLSLELRKEKLNTDKIKHLISEGANIDGCAADFWNSVRVLLPIDLLTHDERRNSQQVDVLKIIKELKRREVVLEEADCLSAELKHSINIKKEDLEKTISMKCYWAIVDYISVGNWSLIAQLFKAGFKFEQCELENGSNILHEAMTHDIKWDESVISALVDNGVDINKKNRDGFTPLAMAIRASSIQSVSMLLKHGANPRATIPIEGVLGTAEQKSLMDFAIDIYNIRVDEQKDAIRNRNNMPMSAMKPIMEKKYAGRGVYIDDIERYNREQRRYNSLFEGQIQNANAQVENAADKVRIAKDVCFLIAKATGTELTSY